MTKLYKFIRLEKSRDETHKYKATFLNLKTNRQKSVLFGSYGMNDYTIYYKTKGKEEADKHKERYIKRHDKREDFEDPITAGSLSRYILWQEPTIEESLKFYLNRFKGLIE